MCHSWFFFSFDWLFKRILSCKGILLSRRQQLGWRPIQGVTCLSPFDNWVRLQQTPTPKCGLSRYKKDGCIDWWMDSNYLGRLVSHFEFWSGFPSVNALACSNLMWWCSVIITTDYPRQSHLIKRIKSADCNDSSSVTGVLYPPLWCVCGLTCSVSSAHTVLKPWLGPCFN